MDDKPQYIDGVYNYCDRWCERCPLTSRCRVFAMEERLTAEDGSRLVHDDAFWESFYEVYEETKDSISEAGGDEDDEAEWNEDWVADLDAMEDDEDEEWDGDWDEGWDPDSPEVEEAVRRHEAQFEAAQQHPLAIRGMAYAELVHQWFEQHGPEVERKEAALRDRPAAEGPDSDPEAAAVRLSDAVEVVRWYHFQIGVKLVRAMSSQGRTHPFPAESGMHDANGSGKVALLGIDRSLAAWAVLREALPDRAPEIVELMVRLERLRTSVEQALPNARAFQRPGFDTPA
jgi:hypothetical protein